MELNTVVMVQTRGYKSPSNHQQLYPVYYNIDYGHIVLHLD